MKVTVTKHLSTYTEGNYRIEMAGDSYSAGFSMFVYHLIDRECPCVVLSSEMRKQYCVNHGALDVPESLQALWFMFHMDGDNR
jgi:hypothetical protein